MLATFARHAASRQYVKPAGQARRWTSAPAAIRWAQVDRFIANDCQLGAARKLLLITGPNMGGNPPICVRPAAHLLAHCGGFVPADSAHFGPIDRIFLPASAPATTWPADARPLWWR